MLIDRSNDFDTIGSYWKESEVLFDTDPDWPQPLRDALTDYRAVWRPKVDEVNACIAADVEMEKLVEKPKPVQGVVRVIGPWTVESVIAMEDDPKSGPDGHSLIGGATGRTRGCRDENAVGLVPDSSRAKCMTLEKSVTSSSIAMARGRSI
jgi:hypothetical protein